MSKICYNSDKLPNFLAYYYRPKRSFGQGNIFTPVCHSVHRGGGSTWPGTPPDQVHPPGPGTSPRTRYTPRPGTPPQTRYTPQVHPQTRYPPPGLGVYLGGVPGLGGCVLGPGGLYLVPGGTWSGGVYLVLGGFTWSWGGVPGPRGCTWSGGVGGTWSQGGVPGLGGVPPLDQVPPQTRYKRPGTPPLDQVPPRPVHPRDQVHPPRIRSMIGRYASYWNTFLLLL